jgi:hypothetical protein
MLHASEAGQVTRLYRSPAPSTSFSIPPRACSTTVAATRFTRAPVDGLRADFLRAPDFRPRFALLLRAPADFRDVFRADDFRPAFRPDFRADFFRLLFRLDLRAPFRAPAFFREPPRLERPALRELLREDFFLDAMNSLLVRWWCDGAKQDSRALQATTSVRIALQEHQRT